MVGPSKQASKQASNQANIHTRVRNEVMLVWGLLRFAPIMKEVVESMCCVLFWISDDKHVTDLKASVVNKTEHSFVVHFMRGHILVPIVMSCVNSTPTTSYFWHATWVETLGNPHPLIKKLHNWGLY